MASDLDTKYSGDVRIDALLGDGPDWNYLTQPSAPNTLVYTLTPNGGYADAQPLHA